MNSPDVVHVFCPNGCQFTSAAVSAPWAVCSDCGTRMTPENEAEFDRIHEAIESDQISREAAQ